MAYGENTSVRNKSWVTVLLAMSSMLINQQYVSYKVCLSRNTHKVIYWSIKNVVRFPGTQPCIFPGNDLVLANSVF